MALSFPWWLRSNIIFINFNIKRIFNFNQSRGFMSTDRNNCSLSFSKAPTTIFVAHLHFTLRTHTTGSLASRCYTSLSIFAATSSLWVRFKLNPLHQTDSSLIAIIVYIKLISSGWLVLRLDFLIRALKSFKAWDESLEVALRVWET